MKSVVNGLRVKLNRDLVFKTNLNTGFIFKKGKQGIIRNVGTPGMIDAERPTIEFYFNEDMAYFIQVNPEWLDEVYSMSDEEIFKLDFQSLTSEQILRIIIENFDFRYEEVKKTRIRSNFVEKAFRFYESRHDHNVATKIMGRLGCIEGYSEIDTEGIEIMFDRTGLRIDQRNRDHKPFNWERK